MSDDELITRTLTVREWRVIANSLGITAAMQDALGHPDESLIRTLELKDRIEDGVREAIL